MILLRPVPNNFRITQEFGVNPQWYPKTNGHNGIDYGTPVGSIVRAAADGQVIRADIDSETVRNPKSGYGYQIRIQHSNGSVTIYAHFEENGFLVKTGDVVNVGQPIGRSGNTGNSTGPHLHFELRTHAGIASAVNPSSFIKDEIPSDVGLLKVTVTEAGSGLRVRLGPSIQTAIVRQLLPGDSVTALGFDGPDIWLRIQDGFIKYDPKWVKLEAISPATSVGDELVS
jgi:hypothetical protein